MNELSRLTSAGRLATPGFKPSTTMTASAVEQLEPRIRAILCAPGVDLQTISARRVRKQLVSDHDDIDEEFTRDYKGDIDAVIARVFELVANSLPAPSSSQVEPDEDEEHVNGLKRKREDDEDEGEDDEDEGEEEGREEDEGEEEQVEEPEEATGDEEEDEEDGIKPHKGKTSRKNSRKSSLTDEEFARQLASELNSNNSRSTRRKANGTSSSKRSAGRNGASRTPKHVKKSRDFIEDSDEEVFRDASDEEATPTKKSKSTPKKARKASGTPAKGGFGKEFQLSPALAELTGQQKMSRPQVVKQIWVHVKEHQLQNPSNRREILCDDLMKRVFGVTKIDMFTMNKELGKYLYPLDES